MSTIITDQGLLHYQCVGQGRPFILLHGWINSWNVWRESMLQLAADADFRVYALDFWGFGNSNERDEIHHAYNIDSYVEMVAFFMRKMGIRSAPIAGHSMGGTVALKFALAYPEMVERAIVIGSPIDGMSMNPLLILAGYSWIARLVWRFPWIRSLVMNLVLARDSQAVRKMISADVERANVESFFRSIADLRQMNLAQGLHQLQVPALGIYGARDNIVSPKNARILATSSGQVRVRIFNRSRHFPMADEPVEFVRSLEGFLGNGSQN